ncbi:16S rRNA (guanine(527)-N(7))-methyltransferase RsmG [Nodosilinea sp. P-1105]|uniref:16S rRNA (guanine(527)-N(7))-methyltransferase RsmG n=1 Tax=Nodosilinea sp. P-1105 TaxID=2546229 RepID=UPI00146F3D88|nr:16S rRNA (guanine(527)-N(7))-methyltransferase RsmG [Nodosilinea sp. P-1105]NMF84387.1 16S rRNA (guanine(527)-N(7))-methyltransferase RsmG [Nodosilinea sp. P-1105]
MADLWPNYDNLWQSTLHWRPNQPQETAFAQLYQALLVANQQVNLTRLTTPDDFWEKHLWDSLQGVAPWLVTAADEAGPLKAPLKVIDIGTGGGFPGLPLALVFPHWRVTLIDGTRKKIAAIEAMVQSLGTANVELLADRAEHLGHQLNHREAYDLALIRAVGGVNTCAEYALPLLKRGGQAILYRGQWTPDEEASLTAILPRLGGKLGIVRTMTTPLSGGVRHNVEILKVAPTPDTYPRLPGMPAKQPLEHRHRMPRSQGSWAD